MKKMRPRVPISIPISAVILLIVGIVIGPVIQASFSEQELNTNVLLSAIPFVLIFVGIILIFMTIIWLVATALKNNIPERIYRPIESVIIAGIILGVIGMFQPWSFALYRLGFPVLLISTLAFILWSHVVPRRRQRLVEAETEGLPVSVAEIERTHAQETG